MDRARELAAATPEHRNRNVDFLRAMSISVVVIGHWLMAVITVEDGRVAADHLLAAQPWTQVLTWFLQVMPVFFIVGGYSNAASWTATQRADKGYANWLRARCQRLLGPTAVFALVWVPITLLAQRLVPDEAVLQGASRFVAVPLWFLAVYLLVIPLAPLMWSLHRRFGIWVPLVLTLAAALIDVFDPAPRLKDQIAPSWGWSNFAIVWLAVHQLGYLWFDGTLTRKRSTGWALLVVGLGGMILLTTVGGYPFSMIGVPGAERTNNTPPSVVLIFLGLMQMGLILLIDSRVNRSLSRTDPWARTILANSMIMTMYLWHLTALVLVVFIGMSFGVRFPIEPLGGLWWLSRLAYVALLAVVLAGFVAVFGRFERPRAPQPVPPTAARAWGTGSAALAAGFGLAGLAAGGFYAPGAPLGLPLVSLAMLWVGAWVAGVTPRAYRRG